MSLDVVRSPNYWTGMMERGRVSQMSVDNSCNLSGHLGMRRRVGVPQGTGYNDYSLRYYHPFQQAMRMYSAVSFQMFDNHAQAKKGSRQDKWVRQNDDDLKKRRLNRIRCLSCSHNQVDVLRYRHRSSGHFRSRSTSGVNEIYLWALQDVNVLDLPCVLQDADVHCVRRHQFAE
jgi:hypothetical protein